MNYAIDALGNIHDQDDDLSGIWDNVKAYAKSHDDLTSLLTGGPLSYGVNLAIKNNKQTPTQKAADVGLIDEIWDTAGASAPGFANATAKRAPAPKPKPKPVSTTSQHGAHLGAAASFAGAAWAYTHASPKIAIGLALVGAYLLAAPARVQ